MRLEDIENEPYKLYKTSDTLQEDFYRENEIDNDSLDNLYIEYNQLENDNIIRKRKAFRMINQFSKELDKINKYPVIEFSNSNNSLFIYTQIYLLVTSVLFFFALFYFKTLLAFILFPVGLYVGDKYGLIEKVEY